MKRSRVFPFLVCLCLALSILGAGNALAAVITVGSSGANHTTIQAAINAAIAGDEIRVAAGTYAEKVTITKANLKLLGGWNATFFSQDPAANPTIIDGQNTRRCIVVVRQTGWTIEGFTLRNGSGNLASSDVPGLTWIADPTQQAFVTPDDGDLGHGGGMVAFQSAGSLKNCRIEDCRSAGSVVVRNAGPDLVLNTADDTFSWWTSNGGGVAMMRIGPYEVSGCTFVRDRVTLDSTDALMGTTRGRGSSGALRVNDTTQTVTISGCSFSDCTATEDGGGMSTTWTTGSLTISNCSFTNNSTSPTITGATGGDDAGGAYFTNTQVFTMTQCSFTGNSCSDDRGAMYLGSNRSQATVSNCTFTGNRAGDDAGAMALGTTYGPVTLSQCNFTDNRAGGDDAGALYVDTTNGPFTITDCTFAGNTCFDDRGAVYMANNYAQLTISKCTFTGNRSGDAMGAMQVTETRAPATITECTFQQNRSGGDVASLDIDNWRSTVVVSKCTFRQNVAGDDMVMRVNDPPIPPDVAGSVLITDCLFDGNFAQGTALTDGNAGAWQCQNGYGNVTFDRCTITRNRCTDDSLIRQDDGDARGIYAVTNCVIFDNVVEGANDFARTRSLNTLFHNNTFTSNSCGQRLLVSYIDPVEVNTNITSAAIAWTPAMWNARRHEVVNCIFANNTTREGTRRTLRGRSAAAQPTYTSTWTKVENNIFFDFSGAANPGYLDQDVTPVTLGGRLTGNGNFDLDPLFVNRAAGDLHLPATSPAVDAGQTIAALTLDRDGRARLSGPRFDVGAYEYSAAPTTPPAAPSNLTAVVVGSNRVLLAWRDNSNDEQVFKLERRTTSTAYVEIAQPAANDTSYWDAAVVLGTTYLYRIRASNVAGDSAYSNEASATVSAVLGANRWSLYGR